MAAVGGLLGAGVRAISTVIAKPNASLTEAAIAAGVGFGVGATAGFTFGASIVANAVAGAALGVGADLTTQALTNVLVRDRPALSGLDVDSLVISGIAGTLGGGLTGAALRGGATEAGAFVAGAGVATGVQLGLRVDKASAAEGGAPVLAGRKR